VIVLSERYDFFKETIASLILVSSSEEEFSQRYGCSYWVINIWLSSILVATLRVYSNVPKKFVTVDSFRWPQTSLGMSIETGYTPCPSQETRIIDRYFLACFLQQ